MAFELSKFLCALVIAYVASRMMRSFLDRMGETAARAILAQAIVWAVGVGLVTASAPDFDPRPALALVTPPVFALLAVDLLLIRRRRERATMRRRGGAASVSDAAAGYDLSLLDAADGPGDGGAGGD